LDQANVEPNEVSTDKNGVEDEKGVKEAGAEASEERQPEDTKEGAAEDEFEALMAEKEEIWDKLLRKQAEFENFKKRTKREMETFAKYAAQVVIQELLPVLDNFERAMSNAPPSGDDGAFREGIEMIHDQLKDALAKAGLVALEPVGKRFDPNFHEAVMHLESDEYDEDIVASEIEKGYMLKDKVLRPAKVGVSAGPKKRHPEAGAAETSDAPPETANVEDAFSEENSET
jgi:molecular chaperone GrpE